MADYMKQLADDLGEAKEQLDKAEDALGVMQWRTDQLEAIKDYVQASIRYDIIRYALAMVGQIQKGVPPA